ncbi:hypothetical protein ACFVZZ_04240 [Streptomyces chartreusis]|uniref:hypothetical protein n=1 Tax=Streptomyces chartreusis TaxID=1969 RepID=UPI0036DEAD3D
MITDDMPLEELAGSWDEIREEYYDLRNDAFDRTVLDCAVRLAEDPGGESAGVWAIGLLMMAPYVAGAPGDGVVSAAVSALEAADGALRERPCGHETHPYQEHEPEFDEDLGRQLCGLYDPDAAWDENHPREQWLCPRNVAGLARIALDMIESGSASDIPPRLPVGTQDTIDTLSALLHGYPEPGTDIEAEIGIHAEELRSAEPADRPGRLLVVMAVAWYAASDFVRNPAVLDELISALETTLPHYADARCTHDRHPAPPRSGPNAAALGIKLSSPAGRALYQRDRTRTDPLDQLLCPVALSDITNDAMRALGGRRAELH